MTSEQQLWGVAIWVEKHYGADGPRFIAEQIGRLVLEGDAAGVEMWRKVVERYAAIARNDRPTF